MPTPNPILTTTAHATWTFPVWSMQIETEFLVVSFLVLVLGSAFFGLQNILLHFAAILKWLAATAEYLAKQVHEFQTSGYKNHLSKSGPSKTKSRPTPGQPIHFGPVGRMWESVSAKLNQFKREEE